MARHDVGFTPDFPLKGIYTPSDRLRELKDYSGLAQSIEDVGLLQPVTVTTGGTLVAGRHRIEAVRSLGWENVPAFVVEEDELRNRLAEIDENLKRLDLTVYEQSKHADERERVLEAMGQRSKVGDNQRGHATVARPKTTSEIAADAGMSKRSYQQRTKIGRSLGPETKSVLDMADTEDEKQRNFLNSTTQLNTVADISNKRGDKVAADAVERVLNGEHKNIYDAYPEVKQEMSEKQRRFEESAKDIKDPALTPAQKMPNQVSTYIRLWEKLDLDEAARTTHTTEAAESLGYDADRLMAIGKLLKEACEKRRRELSYGRMEVVK